MTVASGNTGPTPVSAGYYPAEGSRSIPAIYQWTVQSVYNEDLSIVQAMGWESGVQAAYIDNSQCPVGVQLYIPSTGQVLIVPQNAQGYVPLLFSGAPSIMLSTVGTGLTSAQVTRIYYLNFPVNTAGFWNVAGESAGMYYGSSPPPQLTLARSVPLVLNSYGSVFMDGEVQIPTFSASAVLAVQANATDAFTLYGANNRATRLRKMAVSVSSAATLFLVKRSTVNTGGTFVAATTTPHDANAVASASTGSGAYTANPTGLGTLVGNVGAYALLANDRPFEEIYGVGDASLVLRNAQQGIAWNFNGTNAALTMTITVQWTEATT
jgi:hypothetical protein